MDAGAIDVDPDLEQHELEAYLGTDFKLELLHRWERTLEREAAEVGDEARLFRTSEAYLYNLTAFAMTATKVPYLRELVRHLEPGARVLDYGCGIGSDGLILAEAGYAVEFADFNNPSVSYLRWRMKRRGIEAPVHDLDQGVPGGFDAAYSFDVIEHVPDPFGFLRELEARSGLVMVNLLEPDEEELHHDLPVGKLLRHAASRDLRDYQLLHGRSHLLTYSPAPVGLGQRLRQLARLGRLRAGARPRGAASALSLR